jgi:hypothetical protein
MYSGISGCSGAAGAVGLRREDDKNDVLCCRAHYGRLRRLKEHELRQLEKTLVPAFAPRAFTLTEE